MCAVFSLASVTNAFAQSTNKTALKAPVVNGKAIPLPRVDIVVSNMVANGYPNNDKTRAAAINKLITEELLFQEAERNDLQLTSDGKKEIRRQALEAERMGKITSANLPVVIDILERQYLANAFLDVFLKKMAVDDYAKKKIKAMGNEAKYKVRHILVENESDAKNIIRQLKNNAKFEDLAKLSLDKGDLGTEPLSMYPPSFAEAILKLEKGAITETPVKTMLGWHVIRLDDIKGVQSFEDEKKQISQDLTQKLINELYSKAKIE
jgi:peptidyl-prolyl cis-trans isomerase C